MDEAAFARWLSAYGRAWENGDANAAVALFSPDATYQETPFDEPMIGHEAIYNYWLEGASAAQTDVKFTFSPLAFRGDSGLAHWNAVFKRVSNGDWVHLDGVLMARFKDDLCCEFREWWHRLEKSYTPK